MVTSPCDEMRPSLQDGPAASDALSRAIVETEEQSQMTLMHRFNKAADLLDQVMKVRVLIA